MKIDREEPAITGCNKIKKNTENDSRQITYGTSQGVWNNNSGIAKRRAYKANYGASRWFKRKHDKIEKNKSRV